MFAGFALSVSESHDPAGLHGHLSSAARLRALADQLERGEAAHLQRHADDIIASALDDPPHPVAPPTYPARSLAPPAYGGPTHGHYPEQYKAYPQYHETQRALYREQPLSYTSHYERRGGDDLHDLHPSQFQPIRERSRETLPAHDRREPRSPTPSRPRGRSPAAGSRGTAYSHAEREDDARARMRPQAFVQRQQLRWLLKIRVGQVRAMASHSTPSPRRARGALVVLEIQVHRAAATCTEHCPHPEICSSFKSDQIITCKRFEVTILVNMVHAEYSQHWVKQGKLHPVSIWLTDIVLRALAHAVVTAGCRAVHEHPLYMHVHLFEGIASLFLEATI